MHFGAARDQRFHRRASLLDIAADVPPAWRRAPCSAPRQGARRRPIAVGSQPPKRHSPFTMSAPPAPWSGSMGRGRGDRRCRGGPPPGRGRRAGARIGAKVGWVDRRRPFWECLCGFDDIVLRPGGLLPRRVTQVGGRVPRAPTRLRRLRPGPRAPRRAGLLLRVHMRAHLQHPRSPRWGSPGWGRVPSLRRAPSWRPVNIGRRAT